MANILITGSNGQLGSEIRALSSEYASHHYIFTDIEELDITNQVALKKFFNDCKIDILINAAAFTAVDKAESELKLAEKINVTGVSNLVKMATNFKTKFFHISTDYVFDGLSNTPYNELSPVNPTSSYGKSKLKGETEALRYPGSTIIRTSWLYSSYGHNFVKTIMRLSGERDELKVVFDQVGTPTYAEDLARAILDIVDKVQDDKDAYKPGIYHFANRGVCSWYDLALETLRLIGSECPIYPVESSEYPTPAKRPAYSVLNTAKINSVYGIEPPYWRDSLKKCIDKIQKQ